MRVAAPSSISLISAVPGRQRWEVPQLCREDGLAEPLQKALLALPGVTSCKANPLTGRILLHSSTALPQDTVQIAIERVFSNGANGKAPRAKNRNAVDVQRVVKKAKPARAARVVRALGAATLASAGLALAPEITIGAALAAGAISGLRRWKKSRATTSPLMQLLTYRPEYRPQVARATALTLSAKILDLAPPLIVGLGVDAVAGGAVMAALGLSVTGQFLALGGLSVAVWGAESICEYFFRVEWEGFANRLQHDMRLDAYSHIQKTDQAALQRISAGEVVKVLNADVNQIERFFAQGLTEFITLSTNAILATAAVLLVAPVMAPFPLVPLPLVIWYTLSYERNLGSRMDAAQDSADRINALLVNNILGLPTILSYTAENIEIDRLSRLSQDYRAQAALTTQKSASYNPFIRFSLFFGFGGTILVGGYLLQQGTLTAGAFAFVMLVSQRVLWPLTQLTNIVSNYERTMVGARRIFRVLQQPYGPRGGSLQLPLASVKGQIRFEHVNFSYDGSHQVLTDFSLDIPARQITAIVGSTGTGKTTLTRLLLQFYACQKGRILIDGNDIQSVRSEDLRRAVGLVSQTSFILDGSARENILYGRPSASDGEVERAAQLAEVDSFIKALPQGYETPVSGRLSAGQGQRLCLARAILKDPPILVLDEATSFVDNDTEAAIRRSLERISKDRTILIIAHRLSTVCFADNIVVMGEGGILERGSHEQLLANGGPYAGLWRVQTGS